MKKLFLIVFLAFVSATAFSQKTTLPIPSFTEVDIFGPFDVKLIKSESEKAEIDFNGIDQEDIIYEFKNGTLRLKMRNSHYMDEWKNESRHSKYVLVNVYYKDIDIIEAGAGALVTSKELVKSKYLSVECTMGAEVTLDILAKKVEAVSSMGGVLELSGQTEHLEVKANMGGVLKASRFESKTVYVKANMGADVIVNATEEIDISAGFGASVDYVGSPSVRNSSTNFGGEVNRRGN
ncbi:MAG TPA: head GIN domain-containing protein [Cyclobacteriaceae bacterium]|nr:head GIN domain-containing protein [Cyclobacteriaceae bacterium]